MPNKNDTVDAVKVRAVAVCDRPKSSGDKKVPKVHDVLALKPFEMRLVCIPEVCTGVKRGLM